MVLFNALQVIQAGGVAAPASFYLESLVRQKIEYNLTLFGWVPNKI
jgi:hypothetical protein